jgi:hypothetical protein
MISLKFAVFLTVLACYMKTGTISSTSGLIKIISVWMLSGSSLQCHMAKVHVMGLGEQLNR